MELYVIANELNSGLVSWYEKRTAEYIEDFYNDNLFGGLANDVCDVKVKIKVGDQEKRISVGGGSKRDKKNDSNQGRNDDNDDDVFQFLWNDDDDDDDRRNGVRFLVGNQDTFLNPAQDNEGTTTTTRHPKLDNAHQYRSLQTATDVTSPCKGNNPLIIKFAAVITYRTSRSILSGRDLILTAPFSQTKYREVYIDDYLKVTNGDDAVKGFEDLYCVSRIKWEETEEPTLVSTYGAYGIYAMYYVKESIQSLDVSQYCF